MAIGNLDIKLYINNIKESYKSLEYVAFTLNRLSLGIKNQNYNLELCDRAIKELDFIDSLLLNYIDYLNVCGLNKDIEIIKTIRDKLVSVVISLECFIDEKLETFKIKDIVSLTYTINKMAFKLEEYSSNS